MYPDDPARICRTCAPPHIENCEDCFGFGVLRAHPTVPVSAGAAPTIGEDGLPCPTCKSTSQGWPMEAA